MSRVLVMERHRGLRMMLSKILKGMGIESIEASSVNEIYRHDINLVIADAVSSKDLPDTDIPILIITPNNENNDNKNVHYIRQPFDIKELCSAVIKLTEQCVS